VARLFGDPTINLIPVNPLASPAGPTIGISGAALPLPASYAQTVGKSCVLGLRPDSIVVDASASPGSFAVDVVAVTPLNEKTLLLLRAEDGRELLASEPGSDEAPRRHGPAYARFDASAILLFDAATGRRIASQSA
jgi:multiple sugar transport system ATP-binding protein